MRALSYFRDAIWMRAPKTLRASLLLPSCLLAAGCLSTQDISLGAFAPDAGNPQATPGDMQPGSYDAGLEPQPAGSDAGLARDDHDDEPSELEQRDAAPPLEASIADASSSADSGYGDGGGDASSRDSGSDAASDASPDARPTQCELEPWEPWHCP